MEYVDKYWEKERGNSDSWSPNMADHVVLINLIEKFNLKSFFEIGTHLAFTTKLLDEHPNIERWKSIDIHSTHAHQNIFRADSANYKTDEQFDLVFIDGDHNEVKRDTELALTMKPKIIAWHDYSSLDQAIKLVIQRAVDLFKPINVEANIAWKKM